MLQTLDRPGFNLVRMARSTRDGEAAIIDFEWLVGRDGAPIEHFSEQHRLWMCPRAVFAAEAAGAGFEARFDPDGLMPGRGLWVGHRREG